MRTPLRVGVAGYGVVGRRRHGFIDKRDDMKVVAVCDRTFEGQATLENGTPCHSDHTQLLNEDLDVLFVCISNDKAAEVTVAGLQKGLHVFCEKPPGRDVADIARVIACEKKHPGLKLMYGFNHRYHHSVREALKLVRSGELGDIVNLRGIYGKSRLVTYGQDTDWRVSRELAGGGILLDQGIHMVDLLRLFAGEFTEIHSFISNDFWKHDVEDNAYAIMRTTDGKVAMLHSSGTQWRHRFHLDIALSKGNIILSGILSGTKSYGDETLIVARITGDERGDPVEVTTHYDDDPSWADEISEFCEAVLQDKPIVKGSSEEALKTMQMVYRIYCADPEWRARWGLNSEVQHGEDA